MGCVLETRPTVRTGWSFAFRRDHVLTLVALLLLLGVAAQASLAAEAASPLPGTVTIKSPHSFDDLGARLEDAIKANGFAVVTRASASAGAASRGIKIPGNLVIGVFRNDYAVRMLEASVPAGIEAPLRFYVTENPDGTTNLTYRTPSAIFAPYGVPALVAMATELDPIWDRIAKQATGQ